MCADITAVECANLYSEFDTYSFAFVNSHLNAQLCPINSAFEHTIVVSFYNSISVS